MNKARKVKDGKVFTIYLDKPHLEHVKRIAHHMSQQEGRDISTCEAIRMALEEVYPMNQQLDMFAEKKPFRRLKKESPDQMKFAQLVAD